MARGKTMAGGKMLSLRVTPTVVKTLDKLVDMKMYMNRSEVVRDAIMELARKRLKSAHVIPLDLPPQGAKHFTITTHVPAFYARLMQEMVNMRIFLDKASLVRRALRVYFDVEGFVLLALAKREESKEHSEEG